MRGKKCTTPIDGFFPVVVFFLQLSTLNLALFKQAAPSKASRPPPPASPA